MSDEYQKESEQSALCNRQSAIANRTSYTDTTLTIFVLPDEHAQN